MVTFQDEENGYHARSFEDAFLNCNYDFVKTNKENFQSLKCHEKFVKKPNYYKIANECIDKKSTFATDILYYSDEKFSNWSTPSYIKEGLLWLAK